MDIRGSTTLAESVSPQDYARLMNRFYEVATQVLVAGDAFIDKFVGDEVMAVFLPVFCGSHHARAAVDAARNLLVANARTTGDRESLPLGIGVNSGVCYFGTVKGVEGTFEDFTALGDPVNTAARLASTAAAGEALISEATCRLAGLEGCERRTLLLRGKSEPTDVRSLTASGRDEGVLASKAAGR